MQQSPAAQCTTCGPAAPSILQSARLRSWEHAGVTAGSVEFEVHVRPGARKDAVDGTHDGVLAVRVSAPPAEGRANEAVRRLLAAELGVRRGAVELVGGATSRRKRIRVAGDPDELRARLDRLLS